MSDPDDEPTEPTYEPIPIDELMAMGFDEFIAAVKRGMARAERMTQRAEAEMTSRLVDEPDHRN